MKAPPKKMASIISGGRDGPHVGPPKWRVCSGKPPRVSAVFRLVNYCNLAGNIVFSKDRCSCTMFPQSLYLCIKAARSSM